MGALYYGCDGYACGIESNVPYIVLLESVGMDKRAFKSGFDAGIRSASTFASGEVPFQYSTVGKGLASDVRNVGGDMRRSMGKMANLDVSKRTAKRRN